MSHKPENFIGAWQLIDWRIEYHDGHVTRPFGQGAHGFIIYGADGTMTASITKASRPLFGVANARNATDEQKASAFDSYFHYAGQWRIEENEIVHAVTMSLNPDMVGTDQPRLAIFEGFHHLTLSARERLKNGGSRHHILQWKLLE
jgi:hypothetical protein